MFKHTLCRAALGLALSASFGAVSSAQDAEIASYAQGASRFSAGEIAEASAVFDRAIAAKTDDPRVYFFRGLCAARQNDAAGAAEFYAAGARLEVSTEKGRLTNANDALTSIQGAERAPIEEARSAARAEWKANEAARQQAKYGESLAKQRARLATAPQKAPGESSGSTSTDAPNTAAAVAPIRPFSRAEIPARRSPDLYDKDSDEFNYFREDLGKTELSSKAKARLERLAARVVYEDPMDKPAADGSPFVNIYDASEVFADGEPFVGTDDPDTIYAADEKNALNSFVEGCQTAAALISARLDGAAQDGRGGEPTAPYGSQGSLDSPGSYETRGGAALGPGLEGGAKEDVKPVAPSAADDTKLLFEDAKPAAAPFGDKMNLDTEKDFDLFKADRDFKPVVAPKTTEFGPGGPMI